MTNLICGLWPLGYLVRRCLNFRGFRVRSGSHLKRAVNEGDTTVTCVSLFGCVVPSGCFTVAKKVVHKFACHMLDHFVIYYTIIQSIHVVASIQILMAFENRKKHHRIQCVFRNKSKHTAAMCIKCV